MFFVDVFFEKYYFQYFQLIIIFKFNFTYKKILWCDIRI